MEVSITRNIMKLRQYLFSGYFWHGGLSKLTNYLTIAGCHFE